MSRLVERPGGIGAAPSVGVGSWAKDGAYDRCLERKYPVAGEYITQFEDEEGGEQVVVTASATLERSGRNGRVNIGGGHVRSSPLFAVVVSGRDRSSPSSQSACSWLRSSG